MDEGHTLCLSRDCVCRWLSGPYMGAKWPSVPPSTREEQYTPHTRLGKGAYGEVWRAINVNPAKGPPNVVLKRMFTEQGGRGCQTEWAQRGESEVSHTNQCYVCNTAECVSLSLSLCLC